VVILVVLLAEAVTRQARTTVALPDANADPT